MNALCKVEGCGRPAHCKATCLCQKHQYRMRTHGSTDKPQRSVIPLAEKLRQAVDAGLSEAVEVGECLEWQGFFACKGATPVVKARDTGKQRTENYAVPRLLWEREHGPVPAGKLVYRPCCNNACVRHLACGTRKDWARARRKAGTTAHSPVTKLHLTLAARKRSTAVNSMQQAREVRMLKAEGKSVQEIVAHTGVSEAMVNDIAQGRSWREIGASPFAGLGA